ncbi:MAG: hypothetical protein A2Z15_00350 [Chloroflexi bacterium RBG_16_50_11]|nr:MAG: hypothetical protein A2Z15_00350 [Chloroflexi bacterium RBG_16_50_11]
MARGKLITEELRFEVAKVIRDDPGLTAKEVKARVEKNSKFSDGPTDRAYQKIIAEIRPRAQLVSDLDRPWSILSLRDHEIPAETIPMLTNLNRSKKPLTIREALWVNRLHYLALNLGLSNENLYLFAKTYAGSERACELADLPFDSSLYDDNLITGLYN